MHAITSSDGGMSAEGAKPESKKWKSDPGHVGGYVGLWGGWADLTQTCCLGPLALSRILGLRLIHAMHALTSSHYANANDLLNVACK